MKKRFLSMLLAFALALTIAPSSAIAMALAPETSPEQGGLSAGEGVAYLDSDEYPTNAELLEGYIWKMFSGEKFDESGTFSTDGAMAGKLLTEDAKAAYDAVASQIANIAAKGGSTKFTVSGHTIDETEARQAFNALCYDYPYEMYWRSLKFGFGENYFAIEVSDDYKGADAYTVDQEKATRATQTITNAAGKAQEILTEAGKLTTSIAKLQYFKKAICDLVSYNEAAAGDKNYPYGNPWQMIWVFDGDPQNQVVCEGYSKAFQYLCDKTFTNGDVQCYSVSGYMGAGGHMWNIVTIDQKNYLVDVTNCDDGSIGAPDHLFLVGGTRNSTEDVPGVTPALKYDYKFTPPGQNAVYYTYDDPNTWNDSVLTLHTENYRDPNAPTSIAVTIEKNTFVQEKDGKKFVVVPSAKDDGTENAIEVKLTATATGGTTISPFEWSVTGATTAAMEGITLTPDTTDSSKAVLRITNKALKDKAGSVNGNTETLAGYTLTITATCSTAKGAAELGVYKGALRPTFLNITGPDAQPLKDAEYTIRQGDQLRFTAEVLDQYGNVMENQAVNWSVYSSDLPDEHTTVAFSDNGKACIVSVKDTATYNGQFVVLASVGDETSAAKTIRFKYKANAKDLKDLKLTFTKPSPNVYTGKNITPKIELKDGENLLQQASTTGETTGDYTVTYTNSNGHGNADTTSAGTITVTIKATENSNYTGELIETYEILPFKPTLNVTLESISKLYAGGTQQLTVTAKDHQGMDLTGFTYASSNPGVATVDENGLITGVAKGEANITVSYTPTNKNYTAAENVTVAVTVTEKDKLTVTADDLTLAVGETKPVNLRTVTAGNTLLTAGTDYTVAYTLKGTADKVTLTNGTTDATVVGKNVGEAKIVATVTPVNTYAETYSATEYEIAVTVTAKEVTPAVKVEGSFTYDGKAKTPEPTVTIDGGATTLSETTDYTLAYANNTDAGTAKVIVTSVAGSNYTWATPVEGTFTINPAAPQAMTAQSYLTTRVGAATEIDLANYLPVNYGGKPTYALPDTTTYDGLTAAITDSKLTLTSKVAENHVDEVVTVTIGGMQNYGDITLTITVTYTPKEAVTITATVTESVTYNGQPQAVVSGISAGAFDGTCTILYEGTGSTSYASSAAAPTNAGSYKVTISIPADADYTASPLVKTFTIDPAPVTVKADDKIMTQGESVPELTFTIDPAAVTVEKLNAGITINCNATSSSNVGTYEIVVSGSASSSDGNYNITYTKGTLMVVAKETVATPTANPASGAALAEGATVTLSCGTDGATIHYTADGTEPTADSAVYAAPIPMTDGTMTIKAIAVKAGMTDSAVATFTYTLAPKAVAAPTANPASGTTFTGTQRVTLSAVDGASIYYTLDGSTPSTSSHQYTAAITLNDTATIKAIAVKDGVSSEVATFTYTKEAPTPPPVQQAATPEIAPAGGQFYTSVQVRITCATPGAAVYYSINDGAFNLYTAPFTLYDSTTVRAYAAAPGMENSSAASAYFTRYTYTPDPDPDPEPDPEPDNSYQPPVSSSNSNSGAAQPSTPTQPVQPEPTTIPTVTARPEAVVDGGTASAAVPAETVEKLVEQAVTGSSGAVVIAPVIDAGVTKTEVTLPASAVSTIARETNAELKVETPVANVTIPNESLSGLGSQGTEIAVTAERAEDGGVDVAVTVDGQRMENVPIKAAIPTPCGPGTVAKIVDESGNVLSTVRKSSASGDGQTMVVPLDGSAKVVFVEGGKSFPDVPATNWAADAVAFASSHELMNGVNEESFSPGEPMTRGMLAVVLHNLEGNPGASYKGGFSDVTGSAWYAEAVQWASEKKVVTGLGDGVFAPDTPITREQLVVMLYRYMGEPAGASGGALNRFSDSGSVSGWAAQAMSWAVDNGIVNGSNGALNPQGSATRAEVAQMLMNFVSSGML